MCDNLYARQSKASVFDFQRSDTESCFEYCSRAGAERRASEKKKHVSALHSFCWMGDWIQECPIFRVHTWKSPSLHLSCFAPLHSPVPRVTDKRHSIPHRTDTISSCLSEGTPIAVLPHRMVYRPHLLHLCGQPSSTWNFFPFCLIAHTHHNPPLSDLS